MIYVALISKKEITLNYLNHYLSTYSQTHDVEMGVISCLGVAHMKERIKHDTISIVFFDMDEVANEAILKSVKPEFKEVVYIGIERSPSISFQQRFFSLGVDDCITVPMAHELFALRMQSFIARSVKRRSRVTLSARILDEDTLFDREDIEDFEEILTRLKRQIILMGRSEIHKDDVYHMTLLLGKVQSRFMHLVATFSLAHTLHELCEAIESNIQEFIASSEELSTIALSFINDLIRWKETALIQKSEKVDFMNDSIIANAKMFISMLDVTRKDSSSELDAIFDF